jgi:hypothetical protein
METPKEMTMLTGSAVGVLAFMFITALTYIFSGTLKNVTGMSAAGNTTIDTVLAVLVTITGFLVLVVLILIFKIFFKAFKMGN